MKFGEKIFSGKLVQCIATFKNVRVHVLSVEIFKYKFWGHENDSTTGILILNFPVLVGVYQESFLWRIGQTRNYIWSLKYQETVITLVDLCYGAYYNQ